MVGKKKSICHKNATDNTRKFSITIEILESLDNDIGNTTDLG